MKKRRALLLAAAMTCIAASAAQAVDFKVKGQWNVGFGVGDTSFIKHTSESEGNLKQCTRQITKIS